MSADAPTEFETTLAGYCRQAELTPLQTEVVLLHLVDRMTVPQMRRQLKSDVKRASDVQRQLGIGLARLSQTPGFWAATRQFGRDLLFCVEDRRTYDDRPQGVRGVTPGAAPTRFQGAAIISPESIAARQDVSAAAVLWANRLRPVQVSETAPAG